MIIIHGMNESPLPRAAAGALRERLRVMPAVVVSGARQTGKSTLAIGQKAGGRRYLTLDDLEHFRKAGSLTPGHPERSFLTIRSSSWTTPLAGSSLATLNRAHKRYSPQNMYSGK